MRLLGMRSCRIRSLFLCPFRISRSIQMLRLFSELARQEARFIETKLLPAPGANDVSMMVCGRVPFSSHSMNERLLWTMRNASDTRFRLVLLMTRRLPLRCLSFFFLRVIFCLFGFSSASGISPKNGIESRSSTSLRPRTVLVSNTIKNRTTAGRATATMINLE